MITLPATLIGLKCRNRMFNQSIQWPWTLHTLISVFISNIQAILRPDLQKKKRHKSLEHGFFTDMQHWDCSMV